MAEHTPIGVSLLALISAHCVQRGIKAAEADAIAAAVVSEIDVNVFDWIDTNLYTFHRRDHKTWVEEALAKGATATDIMAQTEERQLLADLKERDK